MSVSFAAESLGAQDCRTRLADLLPHAAACFPRSGIWLIASERDKKPVFLSYSALLQEARQILGGLKQLRLQPGARVALILDRDRDFIPAFWACALGGYVPCPLAPIRSDAGRWATQLAHVKDLLGDPAVVANEAILSELAIPGAIDIQVLRSADAHHEACRASQNDIAVIMLTSGSTGNAKGVPLTNGNILASMASKSERRRLKSDDVLLNWIPFDHITSLTEQHLIALYAGAMQVQVDAAAILAEPLLLLRLVHSYRASVSLMPNFLLGQVIAALQGAARPALDLSCLRQIITGGEANSVETGRRFLELLAPYGLPRSALWPGFGMTETCAGIVYSREFPDIDAGREFASVGFPVTGAELRIVSEQRGGQCGELQVRGPMIFSGYYNDTAATEAAFTTDGWFKTGDLACIEAGRLSLVGRSKDCIIVNGVNYFSHELEAVLDDIDGIERGFVAAFPTRPQGADTEALVVCFAIAHDDESGLYQRIADIRSATILLWGFRPALILPLPKEAFPRTSLGKIQRSLMRKRLEAGEFAEAERRAAELTLCQLGGYVAPAGPVEQTIAEIFAGLFGLDPLTVSATASFFDLGGTSLDLIKLKQQLEERLAIIDMPIVRLLQKPTVRMLAQADQSDYDPIVPLQLTGRKTPLFCVHPALGEVLVYVNLASYFVNERPFYALRARGFGKGEQPFESFSEMVSTYVDAIRKRQPQGPYALAGYSLGGTVVFEIAKVLEAQGEQVSFVGCIDEIPHLAEQARALEGIECPLQVAFLLGLIDRQQLDDLGQRLVNIASFEELCAAIIRAASLERLADISMDLPKFTAWAALTASLVKISADYVPTGSVESMSLFYAQPLRGTKEAWLRQVKCWNSFTRAKNRFIDLPGEHHSLMSSAHLPAFQAVLRAEIDRALQGN
jgi:acyl-CoA synthetase (AMP-forming)/AMP-acid ligase II/thioesterase domain-containing protein/acyl carrier protein